MVAGERHLVHPGQPHAEKHRVMALLKFCQGEIGTEAAVVFDGDAADLHQPVKFGLGEVVGRLVGGDTVFVQPSALGPGIVDRDRMPVHRQPVGAGQPGRPGADNGDLAPGFRRAGEGVHIAKDQPVGGVALQPPDLNRLAFRRLAHAGLFAQCFGRADAGADAAEHVLGKDRARRRFRGAGGDLADEKRDVDGGRAGGGAGRIVAEIAAIGGHQRLVVAERWL